MVEFIEDKGITYGIVIQKGKGEGVEFFTPEDSAQQLGHARWSEGHTVDPHEHIPREREIRRTQETFFIRSGRMRAKVFDKDREVIKELVLTEGDVVLFMDGGHSLEMLEDTDVVMVKQGPYQGVKEDKTRFHS